MTNLKNLSPTELASFVRTIAKQEIENTSYNYKTILTGTIESMKESAYVIKSAGPTQDTYQATSLDINKSYNVGDYVYFLKAESSTVGARGINYLILDKVQYVDEYLLNLPLTSRFIENKTIGQSDESPKNFEITNEDSLELVKTGSTLKISAKFENPKGIKENYGLKVSLCQTVSMEDKIFANYYLDINYFSGQPFKAGFSSEQSRILNLADQNLSNLSKIIVAPFGSEDINITKITITAGDLIEISSKYHAEVEIAQKKDYFSKFVDIDNTKDRTRDKEDIVDLSTELYYNNIALNHSSIQYYWLLKDDTVNSSIGGKGWRVLNAGETITVVNEGVAAELTQYEISSKIISLYRDDTIFSNFKNTLKCLVKFGDNEVYSKEFIIYNYNKEEFNATIENISKYDTFLYDNETIKLECFVGMLEKEDKVADLSNKYKVDYTWYKSNGSEWAEMTGATSKELAIKAKDMGDSAEKDFRCKAVVYLSKDNDGNYVGPYSEELSNEITIRSLIYSEFEVKAEDHYKYYFSTSSGVSFTKIQEEGKPIDWNPSEGAWPSEGADAATAFDVFESLDEDLTKDLDKTQPHYIYYKKQTVWIETKTFHGVDKDPESTPIRSTDWTMPVIAREIGWNGNNWENIKAGYEVDQLNAFNQLTRNGEEQGFYYQDMGMEFFEVTNGLPKPDQNLNQTYYTRDVEDGKYTYSPIELEITWKFKDGEDYWIKNENSEDSSYLLVTTDYDEDQTYYKKYSGNKESYESEQNENITYLSLTRNKQNFDIDKVEWPLSYRENGTVTVYTKVSNKLFINADYINTGTLRVGDSENEKFYASIHNPEVRIGGYAVDANSLKSQDGFAGFRSTLDTDGNDTIILWAGATTNPDTGETSYPFAVTKEGRISAKYISIGEEQVDADTWIQEVNDNLHFEATELEKSNGGTIPAIIMKAQDENREGLMFLDTDRLVVNSSHLNLNHNGESYEDGYFSLSTGKKPSFKEDLLVDQINVYEIEWDDRSTGSDRTASIAEFTIEKFFINQDEELVLMPKKELVFDENERQYFIYQGPTKNTSGQLCDKWILKTDSDCYVSAILTNLIVDRNGTFEVTPDGTMRAKNAEIEGEMRSSSFYQNQKIVSWSDDSISLVIPETYTPMVENTSGNENISGIIYTNENDAIRIVGANLDKTMENIFIPPVWDGKKVKQIEENAFLNNTIIKSIVLPDSLDSIGKGAFENCINLQYIYLPGETTIHSDAFLGCDNLKGIFSTLTEKNDDKINEYDSGKLKIEKEGIPLSISETTLQLFGSLQPEGSDWYYDVTYKGKTSQYKIPLPVDIDQHFTYFINGKQLNSNKQSFSMTSGGLNIQYSVNLTAWLEADAIRYEYNITVVYEEQKIKPSQFINLKYLPKSLTPNLKIYYLPIFYYADFNSETHKNTWHYNVLSSGWQISSNNNINMIASANFNVSQDGIISAEKAILSGDIKAEGGRLGNLFIDKNGLKGILSNGDEAFQLTEEGLQILNSNGYIKIGELKMSTNENGSQAIFYSNSPFSITNGGGSSLTFSKILDNEETEQEYVFQLYIRSPGNKPEIYFQEKNFAAVPQDVSITIRWRTGAYYDLFGSYELRMGLSWIKTFIIPKGSYKSQSEILETSWSPLNWNPFIQFNFKTNMQDEDFDSGWPSEITPETSLHFDDYNTKDWSATEITQTRKYVKTNNTITVCGDLLTTQTGSSEDIPIGYILGSNQCYWNTAYIKTIVGNSDKKVKSNISNIKENFSMQLIKGLQPKAYQWKHSSTPRLHYGFIAQEVEELLNQLGTSSNEVGLIIKSKPGEPDGEDNHYGLNYMDLIAPMVSVIQQLSDKIDRLEAELKEKENN